MPKYLWAVLTMFVSACCKTKCLDNYLQLNYIGFLNTDIDTIVVNAYQKRSNFSILERSRSQYFGTAPGDTLFSYITDAPPSSDYEIVIPSTRDTFHIEDISTRRRDCQCGRDWHETTSYRLDGVRIDSFIVVLTR